MSKNIPKIPRRIVTGYRNGKSTIVDDKQVDKVLTDESGFVISDPWATDSMPVKQGESAQIFPEFFPKLHKNGSLFRYVCVPPDSQTLPFFPEQPGQPHPLMHQTETLDYVVILSGELYLIMEEGETLLKPGDVVIQTGTSHAWSNRSKEPCIQLAILFDAKKDSE